MGHSFDRRSNRISVSRKCVLVDDYGDEREAQIVDVSKQGFKLKISDGPDAGDIFRLLIDGHEFRSQAIWARYGEVGGVFLDEVQLDD